MAHEIVVNFDHATQTIEVEPDTVTIHRGTHLIVWTKGVPGDPTWQLFGLIFLDETVPFTNLTVSPDTISVTDRNDTSSADTFNYRIFVKNMNTGGIITRDPQIVNESNGG